MFWGFSKSIGGGFRLGAGGRIGSGSRRRTAPRPTQNEIRKQTKSDFLHSTKRRAEEAIEHYFLGQGYFLLADDVSDSDEPLAQSIKPILAAFNHTQRLVNDGGNLTEKRKEQMLECVYKLEEIAERSPSDHPVLTLYNRLVWSVGVGWLLLGLALPIFLMGMLWHPFWYGLLATAAPGALLIFSGWRLKGSIDRQAIKVVSTIWR